MNALAALPLLGTGDDHWDHPWWPIFPILWLTLAGVTIWLVLRRRDRRADPLDRARGLLAERYASGEITAEEYRERLAGLS